MKSDNQKVNPMKGVVKPDLLSVHIRQCMKGNRNSRLHVRGALQWLERFPPNPYIVPVLRLVMERSA